ncbi:MAG TPA: 3'-5' exonuclease domain-containing protein 2, partial [Pseudomonas sp.]
MTQKLIIHIRQHPNVDGLPRFDGLTSASIVTPAAADEFRAAVEEIMGFACIGFDTESKPTFKVGEVSSGPHLIQFATPAKAYLF